MTKITNFISYKKILYNIKGSYLITKRVIRWGEKVFGFPSDSSLTGEESSLLELIWKPLLSSGNLIALRCRLKDHKDLRAYIMKLLGSSEEERKLLLSNPPRGLTEPMLKLVKRFIQSDISALHRRLWMTIFFSTRSILLPEQPDISTVVKASEKLTPDYSSHVKGFWRELRYSNTGSIPKKVRWKEWHVTSKQGPNGFAMHTLWRDFISIPETLRESIEFLGGERFRLAWETMKAYSPLIQESKIPTLPGEIRKLSSFGDIEGKTRIVAIMDYFSQTVLKPLHQFLYGVLRKIPQDHTFNQGGFVERIKDWKVLYSCDLTAATDRFPIQVISTVLQGILPKDYCDHWVNIMVGYPFGFQDGTVRYGRGNPMGAYSSWASFALAHHFVMYVCCKRLNLQWKSSKYSLLGDDILIGDTSLYQEYRKVLSELDLPVSEAKTHESLTLCEFAKRWFYQGEEVTPFPIPAMKEAKNYTFLTSLLVEESKRGYEVDIPSSTRLWFELKYENDRKLGRARRTGFFQDIEVKSYICEQIIHTFRKNISFEECFRRIIQRVSDGNPIPSFWTTPRIHTFWVMYLRDLWVSSSKSFMDDQDSYYEGPKGSNANLLDPYLITKEIVQRSLRDERILLLMDEGLVDSKLLPWIDLADLLTCTSDDSYFTIVQLLKQDQTIMEGWDAVKRLILPKLGLVFKGRKYDVIKIISGKMSRDILEIFRKGKRVSIPAKASKSQYNTMSYIAGIGSKEEMVEVDILNPLIGLESWEGEPY